MSAVRLLAVVLATMWLAACAKEMPPPDPIDAPELPDPGTLLTLQGREFAMEELAAIAASADYVLVGEGHDQACDHKVQADLLDAMARLSRPVVGLEMVDVSRQPVLDRFNNGEIGLDEVAEALEWDTRWGFDFDLYRRIFLLARENNLRVAALNIPREVLDKVKKNQLDELDSRQALMLPDEVVPVPEEQRLELEAMFLQHAEMQGVPPEEMDAMRERFLLTQAIWDSTMAERAVQEHRFHGGPVLVLAGSAHVRHGWGITHRINKFDPNSSILNIVPWRGGQNTWAGGDVLFHCPVAKRSRLGMELTETGSTVRVVSVQTGSRARRAGLQPGDELRYVNGHRVEGLFTLHKAAVAASKSGEPLGMVVDRSGERVVLDFGVLKSPHGQSSEETNEPDAFGGSESAE